MISTNDPGANRDRFETPSYAATPSWSVPSYSGPSGGDEQEGSNWQLSYSPGGGGGSNATAPEQDERQAAARYNSPPISWGGGYMTTGANAGAGWNFANPSWMSGFWRPQQQEPQPPVPTDTSWQLTYPGNPYRLPAPSPQTTDWRGTYPGNPYPNTGNQRQATEPAQPALPPRDFPTPETTTGYGQRTQDTHGAYSGKDMNYDVLKDMIKERVKWEGYTITDETIDKLSRDVYKGLYDQGLNWNIALQHYYKTGELPYQAQQYMPFGVDLSQMSGYKPVNYGTKTYGGVVYQPGVITPSYPTGEAKYPNGSPVIPMYEPLQGSNVPVNVQQGQDRYFLYQGKPVGYGKTVAENPGGYIRDEKGNVIKPTPVQGRMSYENGLGYSDAGTTVQRSANYAASVGLGNGAGAASRVTGVDNSNPSKPVYTNVGFNPEAQRSKENEIIANINEAVKAKDTQRIKELSDQLEQFRAANPNVVTRNYASPSLAPAKPPEKNKPGLYAKKPLPRYGGGGGRGGGGRGYSPRENTAPPWFLDMTNWRV